LHKDEYKINPRFKADLIRFNYSKYKGKARKEIKDEEIIEYFNTNDDSFIKQAKKETGNRLKDNFEESFKYETYEYGKPDPDKFTYRTVMDFLKKDKREKEIDKSGMSEDVRSKIINKLVDGKAEKAALKDAQLFAVDAYRKVESLGKEMNNAFKDFAQKKHQLKTHNTDWVKADTKSIKGVGKEPELVTAITNIYQDPAISDAIKGKKAAFVAFLVEKEEARDAELEEVREEVVKKLKEQKAVNLAREKARNAALKLTEALDAGKKFKDIKDKPKFDKVPEFTGKYAPAADGQLIAKLAVSTAPGKVSATENTDKGALFIYTVKRISPNMDDFEKEKDNVTKRYEQQKKQAAFLLFNEWVETNSKELVKLKR